MVQSTLLEIQTEEIYTYGHTETCEIDIAKHRNGPAGHVTLMFDKQRMMFQDRISYY